MFDTDGNGKGEYWAGAADWNAAKIMQIKFRSHGLDELWEPMVSSDATFQIQLKAVYVTQKPIMFYYWTPEWIHSAYDLVPVAEPAWVEGCNTLKMGNKEWLALSTIKCKPKDSKVYVAYSKSLTQRNPAVAKFLSQIQLDPDVVSGWIFKISREKKSPQDVASEWVNANRETVATWVQ